MGEWNLSQLQGEEKLLLARLEDLAEISGTKYIPKFTSFLNERQVMIAEAFIRQRHLENTVIDGGYPDAVRRVAGFFPPYAQPDTADFPFTAIAIHYKKDYTLNHRDFLGSLMGLQIKRESVGDLLIEPGCCTAIVLRTVAPMILGDLKKVGRIGVKCSEGDLQATASHQEFVHLQGTVSSRRLDCLVSMLTKASREKSAAMIRAELVQMNYATVQNGAKTFEAGECITIRGYGKFIVDEIGPPNRKGRLAVLIKKYS